MKNTREQPPCVYVLSRSALREMDRISAEDYGLPTIVLMENAALHCADVAFELLEHARGANVLIVCGPGSNGGDGLALARHLHNAGLHIMVVVSGISKATGDAAVQLRIVRHMGIAIRELPDGDDAGTAVLAAAEELCGPAAPDLVVDALFGTGLSRGVTGPSLLIIGAINKLAAEGSRVLAIDVPSGLDADTGEPLGGAVRASVTVSLAAFKKGFLGLSAQPFVGDIVVADIGAPRQLLHRLGEPLPQLSPAKRRTSPKSSPKRTTDRRRGG